MVSEEKLFELVKENVISRLHQEISDRLDYLNHDEFIEYYFPDLQDNRFEIEVKQFHEFSNEKVIDEMVDFVKSELSSLELAIWDIIKEDTYNDVWNIDR